MVPGQLILVCDVGGGTTDFSVIVVRAGKDGPRFDRLAVGDHLMLGGDNMDLTIARSIETRLFGQPGKLDSKRWHQLCHQCRKAKETLLADPEQRQIDASWWDGRQTDWGHSEETVTPAGENSFWRAFPELALDVAPAPGGPGSPSSGCPMFRPRCHPASGVLARLNLLLMKPATDPPGLLATEALTRKPFAHALPGCQGWFHEVAGDSWALTGAYNLRPELAVAVGAACTGWTNRAKDCAGGGKSAGLLCGSD
jgi:hypothetical protein